MLEAVVECDMNSLLSQDLQIETNNDMQCSTEINMNGHELFATRLVEILELKPLPQAKALRRANLPRYRCTNQHWDCLIHMDLEALIS